MSIQLRMVSDEFGNHSFIGMARIGEFKCSQCRKEIKEGYICGNNKRLVLCKECQDKFPMNKCKHNKEGEHQHIKFRREVREE